MIDASFATALCCPVGDYVHVDGIHLLSACPENNNSGRGLTVGKLMHANFADSFWPTTSAAMQQGPGHELSWNDLTVRVPGKVPGRDRVLKLFVSCLVVVYLRVLVRALCGTHKLCVKQVKEPFLLQAQCTVTGFIWHGNDHYVAYLVHGQQWYCLNHAVVTEATQERLPADPYMIFLQKVVRQRGKSTKSSTALPDDALHAIWMRLPEALALAATQQLPSCGLSCEQRQRARPSMGRFARRFARKMRLKSQDGGVASRKRARSVPEDPEEEGRSRKRARARHRPGREVRQARQDSRKDRAGHQRQRHLADERAGREARARQDTAFSAASWSSNMDGSRADKINNEDNPFQRFRHAFSLTLPQEHQKLREWPEQPVLLGAQPCLPCSGADFASRGKLLAPGCSDIGMPSCTWSRYVLMLSRGRRCGTTWATMRNSCGLLLWTGTSKSLHSHASDWAVLSARGRFGVRTCIASHLLKSKYVALFLFLCFARLAVKIFSLFFCVAFFRVS